MEFARPRIVVSRCLGFYACRYDGEVIPDRFLERLGAHVDFETVCPEVEIGLGTPRDPIRIESAGGVRRLVQPATGLDLTERMNSFRDRFLASLRDVDGFVLKTRSPSCGITDAKIHPPRDDAPPTGSGPGVFAAGVLERFPDAAVEDEVRLEDFPIREHFLTRIFARASFREVRRRRAMRSLVEFHSNNGLLLLAANHREMLALGKIVANHESRPIAEVLADYERHLALALSKKPPYASHLNVLMLALGHFKKGTTSRERTQIVHSLGKYREARLPLSAVNPIIRSWIARFEVAYLRQQTFFSPFPDDLVEITDSGKGRG